MTNTTRQANLNIKARIREINQQLWDVSEEKK